MNHQTSDDAESLDRDYRYARRVGRMRSSAIREILKVTERPEVISFAGGLPASELFPLEPFRRALADATSGDSSTLQYSGTEGYAPLREQIAAMLARTGMAVSPDEILITNGSQQALDLVAKLFLDPGDPVVVESPSYLGALQALESYEARLVAVDTTESGPDPGQIETALVSHAPKLVYLTPTFKNPTGVTVPLDRRRAIADMIERHDTWLIEDDPYGDLRYEGEALPAIRGLGSGDRVIYLGTFSKIVAPGLRLGWIAAPRPLIAKLVMAKQATDLHTGTLVQRALSRYLADNDLAAHIETIRHAYGERLQAMLGALDFRLGNGATWTRPEGGMFVWVALPTGRDTTALLAEAIRRNVAYVPGEPFFPSNPVKNCLRLNFSNSNPAQIQEGISRLAEAFSVD